MEWELISIKKMALLAAASVVSVQAYAFVTSGWYAEYYSDDTYTEVVGEGIYSCQNRLTVYGTKTPHYRITNTWSCSTGFPPGGWPGTNPDL